MVNMTLSIPNDLRKKMKNFSDVRWSEVARKAIETKVKELETVEKILSKSKLTKKDAEEIGNKIKEGIARRHGLL
mgnify:CR=1 FL=1